MKFTKMSLVAALLIGSSAFAIENTKVSGDANLYYMTQDGGTGSGTGLFGKENSAADTALNLKVTTDLVTTDSVAVSAGASYTVVSTLGLENNLVSGVWSGAHTVTPNNSSFGAKVENANWMTEAWIAATAGKTTVKLGRMELDTPLAFTEKWSISENTFEAAVVINQDLPDTTLVAAWVGNGNGAAGGGIVQPEGAFTTFARQGAYAAAVINNTIKPLTVQAWYYNVLDVADAYWLQADVNMEGILAGAQYAAISTKGWATTAGLLDTDAYALMLGYEMKDVATIKVAYSETGKDAGIELSNVATGHTAGSQSKLYTEAWWNYGKVSSNDVTAYNVTIESPVNGLFDLGVYYTDVDQSVVAGNNDVTEFTVTASKSFGAVDATLAYINADVEDNDPTTDDTSNTIQAYLTLNF